MILNRTFEIIKNKLHIDKKHTIDELSLHYKCDVSDILVFLIHHGLIEIDENGFELTIVGRDFTDGDNLKICKFDPLICNMVLYDLLFAKNHYDIDLLKKLEKLYRNEINIKSYSQKNKFEITIAL